MDKQQTTRRAAIYCRVSSIHQGEDGSSLDTQEQRCRDYCLAHNYEIVMVKREMHSASEYRERPGLRAIRDAVREGKVNVVVAYALDRLSRNQAHIHILDEEITDHGAQMEFVTEMFDDSAIGRFIRSARGFVAEVEREKIYERMSRGRRARAEAGKMLPGCKPLYGYVWRDKAKTGYTVNEVEAAVVRRIYTAALSGQRVRQIAMMLNNDRVPSPMGKRWSVTAIHRVLTAEQYTGIRHGWRDSDGVIMLPEGTVPPLIDAATFRAVRARLAFNAQASARRCYEPEATLLRSGFLRCGTCGRSMMVQYRQRGGYYYRCNGATQPGYMCKGPTIDADHIDTAVWSRIVGILTEPDRIAYELERLRANDPARNDLDAVDRALRTIDQQRTRLAKALTVLDDASAELVIAELSVLSESKRNLEIEREAIVRSRSIWEQAQRQLDDVNTWCQRVARNIETLTYEEKRQALLALGVKVMVYPVGSEYRWRMTADVPLDVGSPLEPQVCVTHY